MVTNEYKVLSKEVMWPNIKSPEWPVFEEILTATPWLILMWHRTLLAPRNEMEIELQYLISIRYENFKQGCAAA